jgi:hypothetical protein
MAFNFGPSNMMGGMMGRGMTKANNRRMGQGGIQRREARPMSFNLTMPPNGGFNPSGGGFGGGGNTGFTGIGMPGGTAPPPMTNMNRGYSPMMNNPNTGVTGGMWDRFNANMGGNTGIAGGLMNRPEGGIMSPRPPEGGGFVGPTPGVIGGMDQGRMGDMYRRGRIQTMF